MIMTAAPNKSPKRTRNATSVIGPTSRSAISIHKNEDPQMAPNVRKTAQCFVFNLTPLFLLLKFYLTDCHNCYPILAHLTEDRSVPLRFLSSSTPYGGLLVSR